MGLRGKLLIYAIAIGALSFLAYQVLFPYYTSVPQGIRSLELKTRWGDSREEGLRAFSVPDSFEEDGAPPSIDLREETLLAFDTGLNMSTLRQFLEHWRAEYEPARARAKLNKHSQFLFAVNGLDLHFYRIQGKRRASSKAILLLHGWPGSVVEFLDFMELLHAAYDNYDIIVPSLPGYGWSGVPQVPSFSAIEAAKAFVLLLEKLQYSHYVIQAGDWGAIVGTIMAQIDEKRCAGLHLNFVPTFPEYGPLEYGLMYFLPSVWYSVEDYEKMGLPLTKYFANVIDITGYMHLQATRPDTLGIALAQSRIALAAWFIEKFEQWSDVRTQGLLDRVSPDALITNLLLYWNPKKVVSAGRLYRETLRDARFFRLMQTQVAVPTAVADFPGEMMRTPRRWVAKRFPGLVSYTTMASGGHFAVMEEPQAVLSDFLQFLETIEY